MHSTIPPRYCIFLSHCSPAPPSTLSPLLSPSIHRGLRHTVMITARRWHYFNTHATYSIHVSQSLDSWALTQVDIRRRESLKWKERMRREFSFFKQRCSRGNSLFEKEEEEEDLEKLEKVVTCVETVSIVLFIRWFC